MSETAAQSRNRYRHLLAIFSDGAAGNVVALVAKHEAQPLVAHRAALVLVNKQLRVGMSISKVVLGGEEVKSFKPVHFYMQPSEKKNLSGYTPQGVVTYLFDVAREITDTS